MGFSGGFLKKTNREKAGREQKLRYAKIIVLENDNSTLTIKWEK